MGLRGPYYVLENLPSELERFVAATFASMTSQTIDGEHLLLWTRRLENGSTRSEIAREILRSPAARSAEIERQYRKFLDRPPTIKERDDALRAFKNGLTRGGLQAKLLSSQEYYERGAASFVDRIFQDVLGRWPSADEKKKWGGEVASPAVRRALAPLLRNSDEGRMIRVQRSFAHYRGRAPTSRELSRWLERLKADDGDDDLDSEVAGA